MTKSLAAVFHGAGRELEMRRLPTPTPRGREILVRVLGCTLCGSDLHTFNGRRETPAPTILGHEIVGEIVALGEGAEHRDLAGSRLQPGDRVAWSVVAHCGECFYCRRGLPQKCLAAVKYGHERFRPGQELLGGLAEHCLLVSNTSVARLPDELPLSVACPASCATATVAAALAAAGDLRDGNVCLFGAGLLGLTAAAMLKVAGAGQIVCVDVNEGRLEQAQAFGATHVASPAGLRGLVKEVAEGRGFDVVLELSGSPSAFESGWQCLRLGGKLVLVGAVFPTAPVALPPDQIVRRNLAIQGVHNYAPRDLLAGIRFLGDHHHEFPFSELVAEWFPLASAAQAFQAGADPSRIRVGVRPGG